MARSAAQDLKQARYQIEAKPTRVPANAAKTWKSSLESRIERNEAVLDLATKVLHDANVPDLERDILFHRFVLGEKWLVVSRSVNYSVRACQTRANKALARLG